MCLGSSFIHISLDFMVMLLKASNGIFSFFTELSLIMFFQINTAEKIIHYNMIT
jgi:hypothetical protein